MKKFIIRSLLEIIGILAGGLLILGISIYLVGDYAFFLIFGVMIFFALLNAMFSRM